MLSLCFRRRRFEDLVQSLASPLQQHSFFHFVFSFSLFIFVFFSFFIFFGFFRHFLHSFSKLQLARAQFGHSTFHSIAFSTLSSRQARNSDSVQTMRELERASSMAQQGSDKPNCSGCGSSNSDDPYFILYLEGCMCSSVFVMSSSLPMAAANNYFF